ncbi:TPA: hypothetical protein DDW69_01310 [candidate division CPR2 bacterium]|uniref:Thioredoxin-like fold domain-containing protein n=1 Tax=candidate division CPR2 bacterium GW2011_GWC1_41_48 TaxID=1618344 RepID=A0A0G0Z9G0_UNCC2|nr:MAG: hypothetical protein UT47_C0001G0068 [candidate division CPR2 bacterium GW2011_GWC2_39_35]KKR27092.1 MAG: hypothetical protein UT59_C0070G0001 [candidate division CPR2 bacterium GW2011_GWD1_39_7]KKR29508.1 MAG: hypothetical protein UT60_C0001G0044 [candidate division CPR2 bacterium GW2011_GWD2_39_7]KKS09663.1 MAG: hypothetical protein UU65_C0001G0068 [candidate division CPR2 bacterium GW2011_GWC1_41_48]OGB56877.1 MAG: hypothetical protein A2Y27_01945 [candidate division CPR2 bacterium G
MIICDILRPTLMKVLIFSKDNSSYFEERALDDFESNLKSDHFEVEKLDTENVDGNLRALLYDIMTTPSVVVTTSDGQYIRAWSGELPPLAEIKYYLTV